MKDWTALPPGGYAGGMTGTTYLYLVNGVPFGPFTAEERAELDATAVRPIAWVTA